MRLLPDTNVLIYDTVEDVEEHEQASNIIETTEKVYIITTVILEYLWVMARKLGIRPLIVAEKLNEYAMLKNTKFVCEPVEVFIEALKLLHADGASSRQLNDYVIISAAKKFQATIATYDKELERLAQKNGIPVL